MIARNPEALVWQVQLNGLDARLGKTGPAIESLRKLSQQKPSAKLALAEVEAMAGHRNEALAILPPLERDHPQGKFFTHEFAAVYAALGDEPNAVQWLERAVDAREAPMYYLPVAPAFAKFQNTPEFHRLKNE